MEIPRARENPGRMLKCMVMYSAQVRRYIIADMCTQQGVITPEELDLACEAMILRSRRTDHPDDRTYHQSQTALLLSFFFPGRPSFNIDATKKTLEALV